MLVSPRAGLFLVVGMALAAHGATLANGFVFDDLSAVVENPVVSAPFDPGRLLATNFWGQPPGGDGGGSWRPLAVLTFWLDWRVGDGRPWAFHLTNVVLHALAALALALAVGRMSGRPLLGVLCGTVFAVMAANTEAVASVVGRADVMAAGLAFLAWRLAGPPTEALRPGRAAAVGAAFLAALLGKESALALAACLPAIDLAGGARRSRVLRLGAALAAAIAMYLLARWICFAPPEFAAPAGASLFADETLAVRAWSFLGVLTLGARIIVAPVDLAPDYSFAALVPQASPLAYDVVVGALLVVALIAGLLVARRRSVAAAAGIALFAIGLAAACARVVAIPRVGFALPLMFAEHLLYLPAAGAALALAALAYRSRVGVGLLVVFAAANFGRGVARDLEWRSQLTLFQRAVATTPRCARAWSNYSAALADAGRYQDALSAARRAAEIAPRAPRPYVQAGIALDRLGRSRLAEKAFRLARSLDRTQAEPAMHLARFLAKRARHREAAEVLREVSNRGQREESLLRELDAELARRRTPHVD